MLNGHVDQNARSSKPIRLVADLDRIDWNFAKRTAQSPLEGVHPYPAKFIGDIPRSLIRAIGLPHDTIVFDPFCGSGATLVESQRLGYGALGVDLNPIACLISRVKTQPLPQGAPSAWKEITFSASCNANCEDAGDNIPNVGHWFCDDVRRALGALTKSIRSQAPVQMHDFLFSALSSILVRVSNQESDTRYAAITKDVTGADVFKAFEASCNRLHKALASRSYPLTTCEVLTSDILEIGADAIGRNVGLVITSPPYPNAYEYWLYHKYRMWWLGYDPIGVREREIGARPHYFKKDHQTEEDFKRQMVRVFGLIRETLIAGGYACFIIGRSKIHGRLIDNAALLRAAAEQFRFDLVYERDRTIRADRKSFNLSHAKIKQESLIIFRAA